MDRRLIPIVIKLARRKRSASVAPLLSRQLSPACRLQICVVLPFCPSCHCTAHSLSLTYASLMIFRRWNVIESSTLGVVCGQILILIICRNRSLSRQKQILPITRGRGGYIMISRYFLSDLASTYPPGKQIKHMMYLWASAALALAPRVPLYVFVRSHRQVLGEGGEMGGSRNNLYCSFLSPSLPLFLPCHLYM